MCHFAQAIWLGGAWIPAWLGPVGQMLQTAHDGYSIHGKRGYVRTAECSHELMNINLYFSVGVSVDGTMAADGPTLLLRALLTGARGSV